MPRTYIRKRAAATYSTEELQEACEAVQSRRMTYRQAQDHYGIDKSVIYQRLHGRRTSMNKIGGGRPRALSDQIEDQLEQCVLARAEWGYPVDRNELLDIVKEYVETNNIKTNFKDNRPGEDWYLAFMKRRPRLSLKKPEQLQQKRAEAADPFVVFDFYEKLKSLIQREGLQNSPELILNCDETGFCTDPSKVKAIGLKGQKSFYRRVGGTGRENISVHCCASASGRVLPPLVIFKAKGAVQARWTNHEAEFPGTVYATTENGYMEEPVFFSWLTDSLIPYINNLRQIQNTQKKAILIMDGHKSHISLRVVNAAINADLILLKLPSHLTHRMQPLDKCVFGPLKTGWEKILVAYGRKNLLASFNTLNRKIFVELLAKAWRTYLSEKNIISGFRETGCFPVDSSKFPEREYDQNKLNRYKSLQQQQKQNNKNKPAGEQENIVEVPEDQGEKTTNEETVPPLEPDNDLPELEVLQAPSTLSQNVVSLQPSISQSDPLQSESLAPQELDNNKPTTSDGRRSLMTPQEIDINEPTTSDGRRSLMDVFLNKMRKEFAPPDNIRSKEKQIRVKKEAYGEILTSKEVRKRLKEEEDRRNAKKSTKTNPTKTTKIVKNAENKSKFAQKQTAKKKKKISIEESSSESDPDDDLLLAVQNLTSSDDNSITGDPYDDNIDDEPCCANKENRNANSPESKRTDLKIGSYFAVDYVSKWYIGRVNVIENDKVTMKFLERIPEEKFRWPKRDDIDTVSQSACFMGPIKLDGVHSFTLNPKPTDIQKRWLDFQHNTGKTLC